ncbi:VanZ family protein [Flavobacterium silvaticum]|uniref:VanZ-like domain-containing protein n=1 Tax=Flavobacterium silvaticum TaxID=1852020 RepID=A0A972JHG2_9FLAO|nr:VanZ family protein [Flavobacterium silvaticum]NMH27103.1 hypothetical protein [Flavobacterium silvaticum]
MPTKTLSVPKKIWLVAAWTWTIFVLVLCLISFNDLPNVTVSNVDKYVHLTFHFIFTILWFKVFDSENTTAFWPKLVKVMLLSLFFGIFIEIAQGLFTKTRQADVMDVLANFSGCLIAVMTLFGIRFLGRK